MSGFPSHIWRKQVCALPIPAAQKVVLIRMAEYADYRTGADAWPGRDALADDCGVSPSVVDRARNAGRKHGVIVQTAGGHKGANPVYKLVLPKDVRSGVLSGSKDVSSDVLSPTDDSQRTSVVTPYSAQRTSDLTPLPTPNRPSPREGLKESEPEASEPSEHHMHAEGMVGLGERVVCSCGKTAPWRRLSGDDLYKQLQADKQDHLHYESQAA